jgi:hypothetical protein
LFLLCKQEHGTGNLLLTGQVETIVFTCLVGSNILLYPTFASKKICST